MNVCFLFLPLFICLFSLSLFGDYRKITKISPGGYIFQRPFWRGLCTEGNLHSKIDWGSLYWERNLPFSLCFTLYSRENSTYNPPGGLCSEWRFNGGFFCVTIWGSYFRNFTGNLLISFLLKISVFSVYFSLPFCY